jgi:hypothetical protein
MANQPGGGFMADYDTFPLAWVSETLPHDGRMTIYEPTGSGGVPSLLSANQNEWFRFAWALVENAVQHKLESHWSDMKALQDIYQRSGEEAYVMIDRVVPGTAVLNGRGYAPEICSRASTSFAIHFSHTSVDKGILPQGIEKGPQARAPVAEEWLKGWRKNCAVHSVYTAAVVSSQLSARVDKGYPPAISPEPPIVMQDASAPRGGKPIIFTFYEYVDEPHHTGMSPEDDVNLIQAWARSWHELGWEPRVLDTQVARQHPEFGTFDNFLQGLPFNKVDKICFYRYLAMGMVGGGWMSDFDTFPLNAAKWDGTGNPMLLPNSGSLTIHEKTESGGVPSLVSGNADEWFRLAKAQVENAVAHKTEPHWSDVKALQDIYKLSGGRFYKMLENVVVGDAILRNNEISAEVCAWLQTKVAVHFSHFAMRQSGQFRGMEGAKHRAPVGRSWILKYRTACAE